ncbi:MAG: hypothetical protein DRN95_07615, partial [Candidatus Hydrothermarchaeota archaeon]
MRFVFGIITNAKKPTKLQASLESIWSQTIDTHDIDLAIAGDVHRAERLVYMDYAFKIEMVEAAQNGILGDMRNALGAYMVDRAMADICVLADDDILFKSGFCQAILDFEEDWDVMCVRIENPDGSRYWDWATCFGPTGHHLKPYSEEMDDFWYNTGGIVVCKPEVLQ